MAELVGVIHETPTYDAAVRTTLCGTCPWRLDEPRISIPGADYMKAMGHANMICHETGLQIFYDGPHRKPMLCAGALNAREGKCNGQLDPLEFLEAHS